MTSGHLPLAADKQLMRTTSHANLVNKDTHGVGIKQRVDLRGQEGAENKQLLVELAPPTQTPRPHSGEVDIVRLLGPQVGVVK